MTKKTPVDVDTLEREAFEKLKDLYELAFKTGGLTGVLQVSGEALKEAKFAAGKCEQDGGDVDAVKVAVAKNLVTHWMPAIIKWLNTDGSVRSYLK